MYVRKESANVKIEDILNRLNKCLNNELILKLFSENSIKTNCKNKNNLIIIILNIKFLAYLVSILLSQTKFTLLKIANLRKITRLFGINFRKNRKGKYPSFAEMMKRLM